MSHFELQPATPTVKEIFDMLQKEFFSNIVDYESAGFVLFSDDVMRLFIQAKANTAYKILCDTEVAPK